MSVRVVLADDHIVLRQGLRRLLEIEPDIEVVGEADSGQAAIDQVRQHRPDVVLMDLIMPQLDGLAATRCLRDEFPEVRVVILSGADEESAVISAVRAGAIGHMSKTAPVHTIAETIRAAARGEVTLSAAASARLVQELQSPAEQPEPLTARELEVLECISEGLPNKQIAWNLRISEKTVKSHVSTILGKFGLESRTQAALHATRLGLVSGGGGAARTPHARNVVSLEARRRNAGSICPSATAASAADR